jgi:hypothetical protein
MSDEKDNKNLPFQPTENKLLKSSEAFHPQNKNIKKKSWYSLKEASFLLGISEKEIIEYAYNGELSIYIPTPSGIYAQLGENDLNLYRKNFEESVIFHELVGAYTYYLSSIEHESIRECEHRNQYRKVRFDKDLKYLEEKLRKYIEESKYYDITADLFQIDKIGFNLLKNLPNCSFGTIENVNGSIYESTEDIAELLKKMTKNVPTKEESDELDESVAKISKSKNNQLTDKIPSGTKWTDIEITFIDNDHVRIKVKDKVIDPSVHYSQMGFKHMTSPKSTRLWKTLRKFALSNGSITPKYDKDGKLIKTVEVDDIKRLKPKLCDCFGIKGSPMPRYDKGKNTKKEDGNKEFIKGEGYKTFFSINDESF